MRRHDVVIHEVDASRIDTILARLRTDSGASATLLIDRSGQLLATGGHPSRFDTVSVAALAAGAFSSTGAMARLLGQDGFTALFHEGAEESLHVSAVDDETIVLAVFGKATTPGMVRLFARDAGTAIRGILARARQRPRRVGVLATPLEPAEIGAVLAPRPAEIAR